MNVTTLKDLLEKPFKRFTQEEQMEIVQRGRFTDLTEMSHNDKGKRRTFWTSWYQKVKWLTGDVVSKKLYCWHCVLFPSPNTNKTWNKIGFDDLRNLSQATKKHEESREHIYATVKFRLLCKKNEKKVDSVNDSEKNIEVKRNREYLERLIDISSTLARVAVPFRRDNEEGPYASLVYLFKKYDDIVRTQLEQGHSFHGLSTTIQIGLIQSMEQVMLQKIKEEVAAASFFSLIVDGMNADPEIKHISVSIRYVKSGEPVERFIGLFEVNHATKAEEVAAILDRELEKFNYKDKMITQSYDGKVVKATELYSLQQAVKHRQHSNCQAQLIHYYAHDFRVLLAQSLNSVQDCKLFFSVILIFCKFFQEFNFYSDKKMFESIPSCISTLKTQYDPILRLLEYVTTDEQYENRATLIADAVNLINHLKNFKFMVFVMMFDRFFSLIHLFMNNMKEKVFSAKLLRTEVITLINSLKKYKENIKFDGFIQNIGTIFTGTEETISSIFALNVQVLDSLIHEIEGRFLDIELGDFFELVSLENFCTDKSPAKPDNGLFLSIKENYPKFFDIVKLKGELDLLYSDPAIGGFGECEIKQIKDILKFIHCNDLREHLPELYKLLELVITVPSFAEPLEGKLCVFNRINSYHSSEKREEPRSGLAVLAIERDMLLEMAKSDQWYPQVSENFAKLPATSSIELVCSDNTNDGYLVRETKVETISQPDLVIKTEADTDMF